MFTTTFHLFNCDITNKTVECESVSDVTFHSSGTLKTCRMGQNTVIDGPNFKVLVSNESDSIINSHGGGEIVEGFDLGWNKKIYFLPNFVGEDFPSLLVYYAFGCSLKEVSKENFKGLKRLNELNLGSNSIEKIEKDTFEDLKELRTLYLGEIQ